MKLARRRPSLSLAVLALLGAAALATAAEPAKPARAIRVQGNQFVDAAGKPVVFRGAPSPTPTSWRGRATGTGESSRR